LIVRDWTYHEPRFAHEPPAGAAWAGHRRFGYDLVRNLRPERVVELGVCLGTSFLAFCQAVQEGALPTELWAVDTWTGDVNTGFYGPDYLERFDAGLALFPGVRARKVIATFDDARRQAAPATVDLLHIDGCHSYEAARHDWETWKDTLRPGGVALFHDIAERGEGFGVWRLWEELGREWPTASFAHSHGLGVLFATPDPVPHLPGLEAEWRRRYEG
jgi:hypothetical protein